MPIPLRILHLEEDPSDSELVVLEMAAGGIAAQVLRVANREDFISAFEKNRFDLILAENSLPLFSGLSALAIAREKSPDIPFILVSGMVTEKTAIELLRCGVTDYVLKHQLSRLPSVVRQALR